MRLVGKVTCWLHGGEEQDSTGILEWSIMANLDGSGEWNVVLES